VSAANGLRPVYILTCFRTAIVTISSEPPRPRFSVPSGCALGDVKDCLLIGPFTTRSPLDLAFKPSVRNDLMPFWPEWRA
jgi:hypothetical protein